MQRFTGRNAGVGRGNGVGESACLVPWDPSNLQTEQGYVPDMKGGIVNYGAMEYSIRNAFYTFSDECASYLIVASTTLYFLASPQPIRLFSQEPNVQ